MPMSGHELIVSWSLTATVVAWLKRCVLQTRSFPQSMSRWCALWRGLKQTSGWANCLRSAYNLRLLDLVEWEATFTRRLRSFAVIIVYVDN